METSDASGDDSSAADTVLGWLDRISALETAIAGLQAAQLRAVAGFVAERTRLDDELGVSGLPGAYRSMVAEVAIAKRVSQTTAQGLMEDAHLLVQNHPAVLGALEEGRLGLYAARVIAWETCQIEESSLVRLADLVIADEAVDLLPGKVKAMAERRVIEIDPEAAARRAERARRTDQVRFSSSGADTGVLVAQLPVAQAASCWRALHDHATALRTAGDTRTVDRLMCDTLTERITGAARADRFKADISLVMTDTTLVGLDDTPAHLMGAGPVTAQLARRVAASGSATLRRLYTDPVDATTTYVDTRRRLVDGALRRLVQVADQHCRGIQCAAPIRDIDHALDHASGGSTSFRNSQGLSTGCHRSRDHPGMAVGVGQDTRLTRWTTPSGLEYTSLPPPALGAGSITRRQIRLRHWLRHPPRSAMERRLVGILAHGIRHPMLS